MGRMTMQNDDPTKTDMLPPNAQKAFEACEITIADAEQELMKQWLKLTDHEWTATQLRLEEWVAAGHHRTALFRLAIEINEYERSEL